jgi:hypothetical protein
MFDVYLCSTCISACLLFKTRRSHVRYQQPHLQGTSFYPEESQLIDCVNTYHSATVGTIAQSVGVDILAMLVHSEDIRTAVGKLSILAHRGCTC